MKRLLVLLLLVGTSLATLPNCRAPGPPIPGATAPCDMDVDCEWCERNHLSFDFLCCESGNWIGPHLTNPLLFYLVWNNVVWTMLFVVAFEVVEVLLMTILGSFKLLFVDETNYETLAASLLGDALIQGGLGLLIGYSLRVIFLVPTLGSSPERARGHDAQSRRAVYFTVYLLALLSFVLPGQMTDNGVRWGLMANTGILLIFVWLVYPLAFQKDIDQKMIWRQLDGTRYSGRRRFCFFALWGVTIVVSHSLHFASNQPTFAYNEWYQQWLVMGPFALLLVLIAFAVSVARSDGYTSWVLVGILLTVGWLIMWFIYHIVTPSSALAYGGVALLVLAVIAYAIGALCRWSNVRIPGTLPGDRYSAVEATTRAAESVDLSGNEEQPLVDSQSVAETSRLRKRRVTIDYDFSS